MALSKTKIDKLGDRLKAEVMAMIFLIDYERATGKLMSLREFSDDAKGWVKTRVLN